MSTRHILDRESFEALLADAFAVQESGLDRNSLETLVEIQQFIASEKFDFYQEMQMIADRVLKLSDASGVAIALVDANELVYRAGAGSGTKDIGRRVAVVLTVSSSQDTRQEILRVENAASDTRIEADICRQFGALSLLMLPIYQNHVLMGVLQVLFLSAHSFMDHEIRIYRLMVGALEEGILRRFPGGEKHETRGSVEQMWVFQGNSQRGLQTADGAVSASTMPASTVEQSVFQGHGSRNRGGHFARMLSTQSQAYRAVVILKRARLWTALKTAIASTVRPGWSKRSWGFGSALSAVVVLGIIISISSINHPLTSTRFSTPPTVHDNERAATSKSVVNQEPDSQGGRHSERGRRILGFRRVRTGPNEVDYIADDVTIRRFTTSTAEPHVRNGVKEVNVGDDVTVRYFGNAPSVALQRPSPGPEAEHELRHP